MTRATSSAAPGGSAKRKPRAKTVVEAAASGSQKELLVALRSRLARAVQAAETPPRDLAALSRRLMEVMDELKAIEAQEAKGAGVVEAPSDQPFDASAV